MILKIWDAMCQEWSWREGVTCVKKRNALASYKGADDETRSLSVRSHHSGEQVELLIDEAILFPDTWARLDKASQVGGTRKPECVAWICAFIGERAPQQTLKLLVDRDTEMYLLNDDGKTIERL